MKIEEYIEKRLDDQINWYDAKSIKCKKTYHCCSVCIIVSSLAITAISTLSLLYPLLDKLWVIASLLLSLSITGITTYDKFAKNNELHSSYRRTCERLKQEKYLFLTRSGEYNSNSSAENLLVERCESIMATENGNWSQLNEKKQS